MSPNHLAIRVIAVENHNLVAMKHIIKKIKKALGAEEDKKEVHEE